MGQSLKYLQNLLGNLNQNNTMPSMKYLALLWVFHNYMAKFSQLYLDGWYLKLLCSYWKLEKLCNRFGGNQRGGTLQCQVSAQLLQLINKIQM